ncbi:MAG: phosphocarrier protein Hpr [Oceanicaulis sp. HLUCCA04]|nr:MAG: phosphocarrier protein Hpr [Oceanicaulis sp. HLUCCA04]
MTSRTADVMIVNKRGLHARAAAKFVGVARGFEAQLRVTRDGECADGRSIMDLLMLGAGPGISLTLTAEGADAPALVGALKALVESGFDEGE